MSESPDTEYTAEAWRMTDYYPDTYAKFMSALGIGIDYDDDDWERYRSEFMADLAAHDREVAAKALEYAAAVLDQPYTLWWESAVGATVREGGYDDPSRGVELIDWLRARAARIREGEH